jgi:hypothetical protein
MAHVLECHLRLVAQRRVVLVGEHQNHWTGLSPSVVMALAVACQAASGRLAGSLADDGQQLVGCFVNVSGSI